MGHLEINREQYLNSEQDLIRVLLTYPNRATEVLMANQKLLNLNLVKMMEWVATQMIANGSLEAGTFLQNLAAELKKVLVSKKLKRINQQYLQTKRDFIDLLLTYPNRVTEALKNNRKLLNSDLIKLIEPLATKILAKGSSEVGIILQELATELNEEKLLKVVDTYLDDNTNSAIATAKQPNKFKFLWSESILLLVGCMVFLTGQSGTDLRASFPKAISGKSYQKPEIKNLEQKNILPVKTINAELVDSYLVPRSYTGIVTPKRLSELSFERSGQLTQITVNEGDRVNAGTPLAYLDNANLKAQERELLAQHARAVAKLQELQAGTRPEIVDAASATVRNLTAQYELAKKNFLRRQYLYSEGAISREQLDESENNQFVFEARLEEAKSKLDELIAGTRPESIEAQKAFIQQINARIEGLKIELSKGVLKAPFSGIVSIRRVDEGTVISPSESILRIVEDKKFEVRIGIPPLMAAKIQLGSNQKIKIGNKTYQAVVSSILPEIDSNTNTLTVVLNLNKSNIKETWLGQVAQLEIAEIIPASGYWLPTTALIQGERGLWSCYVTGEPAELESFDEDENRIFRVQRRDVEVLHTESDRVLVRGTIQPNDRIIVTGTHRIVPEQLVVATKNKSVVEREIGSHSQSTQSKAELGVRHSEAN